MNVLKALASEGRTEYALLREKQTRLLADLVKVREEMHKLEDHALIEGDRRGLMRGLGLTILLGIAFTCLQAYEYGHAQFGITSGIYGSTFYMATGFHGFHVIVGTCFLIVCFFRARSGHFKPEHHFGFEAAAWYWHFVDVVWLFLFICVYWWGG